jgi:hypothetical protein
MGPWETIERDADTERGAERERGFDMTEEKEKASEIREALLKDRAKAEREKEAESVSSWVLEVKTEGDTEGTQRGILPACGCPPSHSQSSKRKRTALQDYLFDSRPRAALPKSKAEYQREWKVKKKKERQTEGEAYSSKMPADAAIVEPSDSSEAEILAKEDWERARRLQEGAAVDAQIRALLGAMVRRVELENHQEKQWLQRDRQVDGQGRGHTRHTVPRAVRATLQDMLTSLSGIDAEGRSLKRSVTSALKTEGDTEAQARKLLEIYSSLQARRLTKYRKADDAADQGYRLRTMHLAQIQSYFTYVHILHTNVTCTLYGVGTYASGGSTGTACRAPRA